MVEKRQRAEDKEAPTSAGVGGEGDIVRMGQGAEAVVRRVGAGMARGWAASI
jgi:hypothetical protein